MDPPTILATLTRAEIERATGNTLRHYDERAVDFWHGTRDHDVSQNIEALLRHLTPPPAKHTILDFGCGPGRDLIAFRDLGHEAIGLDGSAEFVGLAREGSGCEVMHQNFLDLALPAERFDGIFANASLFHVPSQELVSVLARLSASLKSGGVLFASNPHGPNIEGFSGERYNCFLDLESFSSFMTAAGFSILEHYYRPTGKPRSQQPWLATVWRRRG